MVKISVITVCLNAGHLLKKTIESVLEQTYSELEYIIVDGASSDDTKAVVCEYSARIQKFISEPDEGLYDAMNKGVSLSGGDLIIFLNAGDFFVSKDSVNSYINKMKLSEADLFFGRIVWSDARNHVICLSDHAASKFTWDLKESNFPHPATIYKRSLFETIGKFNLTFSIAADYEWNVRALVAKKVRFQYIDIIVTVFYADGISSRQEFAGRHQEEIETVNRIYFRPQHLYRTLAKNKRLLQSPLFRKMINKGFNTRLARVY